MPGRKQTGLETHGLTKCRVNRVTRSPSRHSSSSKGAESVKRTLTVIALFTAAFLCHSTSASAQEGHQHIHQHDPSEKLGQVNFTVSCSPQAQRQFNRAVA